MNTSESKTLYDALKSEKPEFTRSTFFDWLKKQDASYLQDTIHGFTLNNDFYAYADRVLKNEVVCDHFDWFDVVVKLVIAYMVSMYDVWKPLGWAEKHPEDKERCLKESDWLLQDLQKKLRRYDKRN